MDDTEADLSGASVAALPGYQVVAGALQREIALGRIRSGQRLPAERRLAEQLGVSRETVRQALRMLEGAQILQIRRGAHGGAFIRDVIVDRATLRSELSVRVPEVLDLTEYRRVVEAGAARLAASRRSSADLTEFAAAQEELRIAEGYEAARNADTRFHLAVAHASGNAALARAIEEARAKLFEMTDVLRLDFFTDASADAHDVVMQAIARGDEAGAEQAMAAHLQKTAEEFLDAIGRG